MELIIEGYIKLHRKILKWEWYKKGEMFKLFSYLLLCASHNEHRFEGVALKPGQMPFGYKKTSKDTGISVQSVRTYIKRLKSTHEITIESTPNGSIITIVRWLDFQTSTRISTNDQQTINTNQEW